MTRLLVHVEGQTEESFVNEVLRPHLLGFGYDSVGARLFGNARQRAHRGGVRAWPGVRDEILRHLRSDSRCFATTMVDYYGMPATGARAWPARAHASSQPMSVRAPFVECALRDELLACWGERSDERRFIPFVVMHEFEALLFSDCEGFARALGRPDLAKELRSHLAAFNSPEEINDSPQTAPSKRAIQVFRNYEKPLNGVDAVKEIGLARIRAECPHFNAWLTRLESVAGEA